MELDFYKIHTCRNDLILLNYLYNREPPDEELYPLLAHRMCDRHIGVGANGVLFLLRGGEHPARLLYYRPNGRLAERVHDALLCLGRFVFDSGIAGGKSVGVECADGVHTIDFIDSAHFRVAIGRPRASGGGSEIREEPDREYTTTLLVDGKNQKVTPLHLGYDGLVVFHTEHSRSKLRLLSRSLRREHGREHGAHPVFAQVYSRDEMALRTWFRNETIDYASAGGMALVAAVLNGFAERDAAVHCNGEELFVQWAQGTNEVLVTGSADYLFSGTYYFEEREPEDDSASAP